MECANGKMGNKLLYSSALLTDRLKPPKNYIPWIVINGVHTDEIQTKAETDLVKLICEFYKVDFFYFRNYLFNNKNLTNYFF